jgi:hypothetical protein
VVQAQIPVKDRPGGLQAVQPWAQEQLIYADSKKTIKNDFFVSSICPHMQTWEYERSTRGIVAHLPAGACGGAGFGSRAGTATGAAMA